MEVHRTEISSRVEQVRGNLVQIKTTKETFEHQMQTAETKLKRYENARRIALAEKEGVSAELDHAVKEKVRLVDLHNEKVDEIRRLEDEARKCSPQRVDMASQETIHSIERKYEVLQAQLRQREKAQGATDYQINERADMAQAVYNEHRNVELALKRELAEIKLSLNKRLERWRAFQRQITARTRVQFSYLLSERRYRGDVYFDHPAQCLALLVEPDETQESPARRNIKTLSGGEKSFSSICLLLSIWEAMGSPIRCLDEFDVFMDNINRAISTRMLVCYTNHA